MTEEHPYFSTQQRLEAWRVGTESITAFANAALRGLLLLNGGAAIAILVFLGQVLSDAPLTSDFPVARFVCPLMVFGLGVFCSPFASGLGFLSQLAFHNYHNRRWGNFYRYSAVAVVFVGWALFLFGLYASGQAFIGLA